MPPKKKPVTSSNAVTPSSSTVSIPTTVNIPSAASTASTTASTAASTTTTSSTQKKIQWCWAGDSGAGASQDVLIEYDAKMNSEIELQYQMHLMKPKLKKYSDFKIDKLRYIDFKNMIQTRYDDPTKMRTVERQEIIPGSKLPPPKNTINRRRKRKIVNSDDSDTASENSDSDSDSDSDNDSDSDSDSDSDDSSDDEDDEDYIAKWFWAGDSNGGPSKGGGHQDVWIGYDLNMNKKLEKAFSKNKKKLKVDNERFVDFQNMLQRRCDDESKRRNLKREDPLKVRPKKQLTKSQKISNAATAMNAMAASHATSTPATTTTTAPITRSGSKGKLTSTATVTPIATTTTTTTTTTPTTTPKPTLSSTMSTISISDIIKCPNTWTDVDSMNYKEVDVKSHENEFQWMSKLFNQTISNNHKGISTLSPIVFNDLKVTRVVRVQNPMLWVSYHARKQKIIDDNNGLCPPIHSVITNIPGSPSLDTKANELYLFHGLNVSSVAGIAKFGFDPRFCSLEGMFGAGLYFAENSSKSNQYCHAGACTCSGFQANTCKCKASDEVCLLVCRVVMGDCLVENVFRGNGPGQFWNGRRTEPKKPNGINIYNSVIGESKPNYGPKAALQLREYIVYESSQVFVEYKVYFKRVK
ncbi:hypothetical protein RB653_002150 [Dictyostelium firmibasis]|uniref:Poly [ADP-ribose] polymerase n=1 Tax=Dictyostelium firmibasis TaxID=79012 RepID=A0AAN7TY03_9MYCE